MRIGTLVGVGLVILCMAGSAAAATPELYLLGGVSVASLGGDATTLGEAMAAALETELPGSSWSSSKKSRTGFDLGVGVSFAFTDVLGGAVEMRYATRGAKWDLSEESGSGLNVEGTMKLNYVEIPVLLQVAPTATGPVRPVLMVGPALGFKTTSEFETKVLGQSSSTSVDGMKGMYLSGVVGAGIKVRATPQSHFLLQARFQPGFTNLVDDSSVDITSSAFAFMAGWSVRL